MKHLLCRMSMIAMLMGTFISCEKVDLSDINGGKEQQEEGVRISFTIKNIEQIAFDDGVTKSRAAITDMCNRITYAFFKDNEKAKQVSQKSTDDGFGSLTVSLPAGIYQFVILAHNGNENPTVTSPEEITFGNNGKLADTFYYYGELDATESKDMSLTLKRAVAMVRFITIDAVPQDVKTMTFSYTGGSSSLNAVTGLGCKNSRQEETFTVETSAHNGQSQYEFYTFPREADCKLKLTVAALMDGDVEYKKEVFEEVPVTVNKITKFTGEFFKDTQKPGESKITLKTDAEWTETEVKY